MVKSGLVQKLCNMHPNILRKDIEQIVDIVIFEMIDSLSRDESVEIRGFGRFKTVIRKARLGRNPKNSETIQIPSKKAIKWKMSRKMYLRLNKNFTENKISGTH